MRTTWRTRSLRRTQKRGSRRRGGPRRGQVRARGGRSDHRLDGAAAAGPTAPLAARGAAEGGERGGRRRARGVARGQPRRASASALHSAQRRGARGGEAARRPPRAALCAAPRRTTPLPSPSSPLRRFPHHPGALGARTACGSDRSCSTCETTPSTPLHTSSMSPSSMRSSAAQSAVLCWLSISSRFERSVCTARSRTRCIRSNLETSRLIRLGHHHHSE